MKSHFLSPSQSRISVFRSLATALLLFLLHTFAAAQTSNTDGATAGGLQPGAPAGAYGLTGFENVNLYNGNLNFSLPLLEVGGRGGAGYRVALAVEQKWRVETWPESFPGQGPRYVPLGTWWAELKPGYGPGVLEGRRGGYGEYPYELYCGSQSSGFHNQMLTRLTFTTGDGTEFELRDQLTNGEPKFLSGIPCESPGASRGTVFTSADGTAATFISDTTIYDHKYKPMGVNDQFRPSGYLLLRDGTRYRIENGLVVWLRDRNGNRLSFTYDGFGRVTMVIDSSNRQVSFSYSGANGFAYDLIEYKGFGGQIRKIKVWQASLGSVLRSGYTSQTYAQLFPNLNGASSFSNFNPQRVCAVELPDEVRSYQLRYNSYGELARVELPTGGAFEYDWSDGNSLSNEGVIYRRVSERRVYPNGTVLESKTTFGNPVPPAVSVAVRGFDSAGTLKAYSAHYFTDNALDSLSAEWNTSVSYGNALAGRESQVESFDIINHTPVLRRRVNQTWSTRSGFAWAGVDPRLIEVTTSLSDSNQVSKQTFGYDDAVPFNNQNNVKEYAFGNGAPGALVRETRTTYLTDASYTGTTVHLRNLATRVSVYDAAGIERARTVNEFDNYATDANHTALLNRANISGLDAAFTTAYTTRGNVTGTTGYLLVNGAVTGSVAGYNQFDIAGNAVKVIDGRGNATLLDYDDCFGGPEGNARINSAPLELSTPGKSSFAFVTKVTKPLSLITFSQFDYYMGLPVDSEDENGTVTSGFYSDTLERPTRIRRAAGSALTNQTSFSYDDANHVVTTTSDLNANNDNILTSKLFYDGLGRTTETRQYEGGMNYIARQVQYDFLGRAFKTSNPFRPWQSETPVWTTTGFDALGRVINVITPDNAAVTTSYSGNTVTVTDQAGKSRKSVTDALGRLTDVYEDPGGLSYQTTYSYDLLDNLVKVVQGSQQRFFMYDSFKRLLRARNPEQSTHASLNLSDALTGNSAWSIGYQYDANGNLTQKTDARGVVSTYGYDALNRNTTIDYSDTSSINPDVKRFYDGASNGKGRFWYHYKGGDYATGSNVDHTSIDGYDALGRPLVQRQLFKLNGGWSPTYQTSHGYNLAGEVTSQTYPSGRTVAYTYDSAGRASSFTGSLGDGVPRTYATGISYSQWGSLSREQFGTNTAVYHNLHYNVRGQLYDVRASNVDNPWGGELGVLVNYYSTNWLHGGSGPDNNGNVLMSQTIINSYYMEDRYGYDALNRLAAVGEYQNGAANTGNQLYDYDRWGNRTSKPAATVGLNKQFTVDTATNRLTVPSGQPGVMTYDSAGNLNHDTYTSFGNRVYDAEGKLTAAQDGYAGWSYYTYNADGQRVRRKINNQESWQIYGLAGELLAEYPANGPASTPQKEYGYRNGQLLVTAEIASGGPASANVNWLVPDHLGTPRIIIDQTGSLANVKRHDYLPFGEELFAGTGGRSPANGYTGGDAVRQQFTSKDRDIETGLDYLGARYYASAQGRFTSVDPTMESVSGTNPLSWNRYAYAFNSPLRYVDPLGLWAYSVQYEYYADGKKKGQVKSATLLFTKTSDEDDAASLVKQLGYRPGDKSYDKLLKQVGAVLGEANSLQSSKLGGDIGSFFGIVESKLRDQKEYNRRNPTANDGPVDHDYQDCSMTACRLAYPGQMVMSGAGGIRDLDFGVDEADQMNARQPTAPLDALRVRDIVRYGRGDRRHFANVIFIGEDGVASIFSRTGVKGKFETLRVDSERVIGGYGSITGSFRP
jgi:RHS repeat-associated protein